MVAKIQQRSGPASTGDVADFLDALREAAATFQQLLLRRGCLRAEVERLNKQAREVRSRLRIAVAKEADRISKEADRIGKQSREVDRIHGNCGIVIAYIEDMMKALHGGTKSDDGNN